MKNKIIIITLVIVAAFVSFVAYNNTAAVYKTVNHNFKSIAEDIENFDEDIVKKSHDYKVIQNTVFQICEKIVDNNAVCGYAVFLGGYEIKDVQSFMLETHAQDSLENLAPYIKKIHLINDIIKKNNSWNSLSDVSNSLDEINGVIGKSKSA